MEQPSANEIPLFHYAVRDDSSKTAFAVENIGKGITSRPGVPAGLVTQLDTQCAASMDSQQTCRFQNGMLIGIDRGQYDVLVASEQPLWGGTPHERPASNKN